jgi:glyoxylase-like metal-dependent hydrolase (beta-lactamase superfamily II)
MNIISSASNNSVVVQCRVCKDSHVNYCYIFINTLTKQALLIDPAWDIVAIQRIIKRYDAKVSAVLITHHHFDHVNLAEEFSKHYDCRIFISEKEYYHYKLKFDRKVLFTDCDIQKVANIQVLPILTPGHTAGSTCYLIENALFTGDTLFNEGAGTCAGNGGDPNLMFSSFQRLKNMIANNTRIYPGHRFKSALGLTFEEVKQKNIYLQFDSVDVFVGFLMRKNQTFHSFV